jgi:hypothetical protein
VTLDRGDFVVYLGEQADAGGFDLSLFRDQGTLWLELTIDGTEVIAPRFRLGSVPYSAYSQFCAEAVSLAPTALEDVPVGSVGVGAPADPGSALTLGGDILLTNDAARVIGLPQVNELGQDLTIQAGGSISSWGQAAVGGELILRAGNANVSGSVDPCPGGPHNNSVKFYAGDNLFFGVCSATRNGNIEFFAGNGQPLRMLVVGDSGNVGINTNDPTYKLHVNGSVAGTGAYNALSDARYKTRIETIVSALSKVQNLRGVAFDWRAQEYPDLELEPGRQIGFIAQEVRKVLPEAVSEDANGRLSVAYADVVPVLVEAIKEQQSAFSNLQAENERLALELSETRRAQASFEERLRALEARGR